MPKRKKSNKKKQPTAVTVIATGIVLLFLIRLYQVIKPLVDFGIFKKGVNSPLFINWGLTPIGRILFFSATYLVLSLTGIVVLIGFLRLRPWAWVLLVAWTGASLTISLVEYFTHHTPNYIVMAANAIIAFALNMTNIQLLFKIRRDAHDPTI